MSYPLYPMIHHRQPANTIPWQTNRRPTLLLLAEKALLPHLSALLSGHNFQTCATANLEIACAILSNAAIDLVLLHPSPEMGHGGWEAYTSLRRVTSKPVLAVANLTTAHFAKTPWPHNPQKEDADVTNYLKLIDFLSHTLI